MSTPIRCRAKVAADCYDGKAAHLIYDEGQEDDGTWDGQTVVCDACYIALGQPTAADPRTIAQPPRPASHAGTKRVPDGHGCTERVPAWELDPYGYDGNQ